MRTVRLNHVSELRRRSTLAAESCVCPVCVERLVLALRICVLHLASDLLLHGHVPSSHARAAGYLLVTVHAMNSVIHVHVTVPVEFTLYSAKI